MRDLMLSVFDKTGNMAKPWLEAGYGAVIVDKQHPSGYTQEDTLIKVGVDFLEWDVPEAIITRIAFASFFPPCTHIAVSGAKHFKNKGLDALIQSLILFSESIKLAERIGSPWIIENPVSVVSTYWRKPDYIFDPCDYGDPYKKKTCLWTGGGFIMPTKTPVAPIFKDLIARFTPAENRGDMRSETPLGFAYAVFESNRPYRFGYK